MRALILASFAEEYIDRLRRQGTVAHESWLETNRLQDPDELGARLAAEHIDVLVVEADFVFEEIFAAASALKLVGVCRNALNQVDVESATAHGVSVTHAPGRNTNAVAELTITLMLALARHIPQANRLVLGAGWRDPSMGYSEFRGREIAGSTVGVVGLGQIGREVARKCVALDAQVLVHDPIVPERDIVRLGGTPRDLRRLMEDSDFVTLHVPDNEGTYHLANAALLASMKPDAYLLNTSGGSVVDPDALVDALEAGTIAGAALDVFEGQPLPLTSRLCTAPNVILTPHIGGATEETIVRHSRTMTEEIERFFAGEPLVHAVNAVGASRGG